MAAKWLKIGGKHFKKASVQKLCGQQNSNFEENILVITANKYTTFMAVVPASQLKVAIGLEC